MRQLPRADASRIAQLRSHGEAFWLELVGESPEAELASIGGELGLSQDALRAATQFGQRPRLEGIGDHTLLVLFGVGEERGGELRPAEVHLLLGADHLVVLRRARIAELERLQVPEGSDLPLTLVIGALIDSMLAAGEAIDDEIDSLEDRIIERVDETQMKRLTELRRALVAIRHVGTPQRDLFLRRADELGSLPGMSPEAASEASLRLVTVRDVVDTTRELASGALDLYLSSVSNRLNLFAERLTIVTIVILPLVVLTGFFGQNFAWLGAQVDSFATFLVFGVLAPAALVGGLLLLLRRRGYLRA